MDLSQILTMSARDYCEMSQRHLMDYEPVGVHSSTSLTGFGENIPENAEVVVDFRFALNGSNGGYHASGTALIPKTKPKDEVRYGDR